MIKKKKKYMVILGITATIVTNSLLAYTAISFGNRRLAFEKSIVTEPVDETLTPSTSSSTDNEEAQDALEKSSESQVEETETVEEEIQDDKTKDTKETEEAAKDKDLIFLIKEGYAYELPIMGTTGYAASYLKAEPAEEGGSAFTVQSGEAFTILDEKDDKWLIAYGHNTGWIDNTYCFINLPDVLPSAIYDCTNAYKANYVSSGIGIPNVYGETLYNAVSYNKRLGKEEFIVPVSHHTAKKICKAQQTALKNGDTLVISECYRPLELQQKIASNLKNLAAQNEVVQEGLTKDGWNLGWFISTGKSAHQNGYAIDVSLAKIKTQKTSEINGYGYINITGYIEYDMPTAMHELSVAAVAFEHPVDSASKIAWKNVSLAKTMTTPAEFMQAYFVNAGLIPLASEWWHFTDLDTKAIMDKANNPGNYTLIFCLSEKPEKGSVQITK